MTEPAQVIVIAQDNAFRQALGNFLHSIIDLKFRDFNNYSAALPALEQPAAADFVIMDIFRDRTLFGPPPFFVLEQIKIIQKLTERGIPVLTMSDRYTSVKLRQDEKETLHVIRPPDYIIRDVNDGRLPMAALAQLGPAIDAVRQNPRAQLGKMQNAFLDRDRRIAAPDVQQQAQAAADSAVDRQKPRILVVDNDKLILDMLAAHVEERGYTPLLCEHGAFAKEALRRDPAIKAAIIDANLRMIGKKHIPGIDVARTAVEYGITPILMSGYLQNSAFDEAQIPYLQKPFRLKALNTEIAWALAAPEDCIARMEIGLINLDVRDMAAGLRANPGWQRNLTLTVPERPAPAFVVPSGAGMVVPVASPTSGSKIAPSPMPA